MAAVHAFAYLPRNPSHSQASATIPAVDPDKLQKSLETLFPDLVVHGTRSCLLGMTTSLTKVGGETHQYFTRLSQVLAFERMMRGFMRFAEAVSPFPIDQGHMWSGAFLPAPQHPSPWGFPPQQQKPVPAYGFFAPLQVPKPAPVPSPMNAFLPAIFQQVDARRPASAWPDYGPMMFIPMALMAAAPSMAMWGLTA
jgi:hypothetical protein